jgi:hypothetical protein
MNYEFEMTETVGISPGGTPPPDVPIFKTDYIIFCKKYLVGELSKWAINQSPYSIPENLEVVLRKFDALLSLESFPEEQFGYKTIKTREFYGWLFPIIEKIPELVNWNVPKSKHNRSFVACSRFDKPNPDDDIVDLSALVRNIQFGLIDQR